MKVSKSEGKNDFAVLTHSLASMSQIQIHSNGEKKCNMGSCKHFSQVIYLRWPNQIHKSLASIAEEMTLMKQMREINS